MNFEIKLGDLILVKGNDGLSHEIEAITHSIYSHVAGLVKRGELEEAQAFRRTGETPLDTYTGVSDVYTCDSLTDEQRQRIISYVLSQIGDKYDYGLIPIEAIHSILHINPPYSEGNRHICSTLWTDAYHSAGVSLCPGVEFPSPADVGNSKLLRRVGSF